MGALAVPATAMAMTFLVSLGLSLLLTRPGMRAALDHPNDRSLHTLPTPRTGGLAIHAGLLVGGLFCTVVGYGEFTEPAVLAASAMAIILISLLDDLRQIPAIVRIMVHLGAAVGLLAGASLSIQTLSLPWAHYPLPDWAAGLFSVFLLVWFTNLYNFMDGIDGLAAGMGLFGFSTYALLGLLVAMPVFSVFSFIIACACLGFLCVNFPPARIFMGDAGSSVLGFLGAGFALWAERDQIFPLWVGILIFSPFVVDATVTLFRRLVNREVIWRAHRSHFYQRLVLIGWSHRKTTLSAYCLMVACGLSALVAAKASSSVQTGIIMGWLLFYVMLMIVITRMEHTRCGLRASNETDTTA